MANLTIASGSGAPSGAAGGDLASTFPNPTLAHYRTIFRTICRAQASVHTGAETSLCAGQNLTTNGTAGINPSILPLLSTDWTATGYTTQLRLIVGYVSTDVAPGVNFVFGLYPVTASAGGTTVTTLTLGTVTSGSTVTYNTPAANGVVADTSSGAFTFPSSGMYIVGCAISGAMAANSNVSFSVALQVRNV